MSIKEYALSKDKSLLIAAGRKIENEEFDLSSSQEGYRNLILNHIGVLEGINECKYIEAEQYQSNKLFKEDYLHFHELLDELATSGYKRAMIDKSSLVRSDNPELALQLLLSCLDDNESPQGIVNEKIGFLILKLNSYENKESVKYFKTAADKYNMSAAQYILSLMYYSGDCVEKDIEISLSYCKSAAENGDSDALLRLGKDYLFENFYNLGKNVNLGLDYLKKSADLWNYEANYLLGISYCVGEYTQKDLENAKHYFTVATWGDIPPAYAGLGQVYYELGEYGTAKENFKKSFDEYDCLLFAESLVNMYKEGLGGPTDIPSALRVIDKMISENRSNYSDIKFAALCYYNGNGCYKDVNKAITYLRLIENNDPEIKYFLGCIAYEGSSFLVRSDCLNYFEYAGNNGYPDAFSKLGNYYLSIDNKDRALEYFKKSFASGNIDDGVEVGKIYESGTSAIYKNMTEAVNWYKSAAAKGSQKAKDELSHIKSGLFGYKRV